MESKPTMNHDNIIANQLAGMSLEEAIFQHGYSSGYERGKREATAPRWVKASERLPKPFIAKFVRIEGIMSIAAWHKDHERFVDDAGDFHPADQVEWLDEQPAALKPTFWDVAKAFKWAAKYNNELGENLVLTEDGQWLLMKREGGVTETEELTPGNVAELYCLQNGFTKEKAEQPAAEHWTPATTKPEHNVGVLVFIPGEDNHITSGMWDIDNKWVLLDEYRIPKDEVTHWMPLPSFPEGYPANELPDEIGAMIKEIAREELGKKEQPAAGREGDAVEFAEWAGWDWRRVEGKSMWENQKTLEVLKTKDLYERYEKATGKKD